MTKTKSTKGRTIRRTPQRTCVACRRVDAKRGLIRLVRTADNTLDIDVTGKKSGRGAYLCRTRECWETGVNGGKLEHSLRINLRPEERELIMKLGEQLLEESAIG